jgi:elongation factor Ts
MAESRNESRNVKQKFDGTKTCAGIVDDIRASVRLSAHPLYVSRNDGPGNLIETEREIYKARVTGKPANVVDKIVDGKLEKLCSALCLLEQGFIKNPDQTIGDLLKAKIAELCENIVIRRFTRYLMGEAVETDANGMMVDSAVKTSAPLAPFS